ncbi:DUF947-domain-containing protein [Trematosphaeria pertusa]|uniref:rRNA biogenesis protein RRP36 n=1 Tax=Trematosphaeria pertusa TaxID=390896 RepID=A0A6A6I083_9PLEO|nr:DUF947-domain-containing protein [Trematosphaeria pertusa]KAF2243418.1 DUF947-domain-containing protein [Trematosphaeria pertusa]
MPLSTKLDRKLRAAEESSDDEEYYEVTDRSSPSVIETGEGADIVSSEDSGDGDESGAEELDAEDGSVHVQMSKVSFGALAKAQDELSEQQSAGRKRKRDEETSKLQEDKLQALRERLQEIKAAKLAQGAKPGKMSKLRRGRAVDEDSYQEPEGEDDDGGSSGSDAPPHARSSKHAPAVQSSKRPVTRKRRVVEVKKPTFRDPRFDNVSGPRPDENILKKRYDFLNDYRASEMGELRDAIKKTKNEADKEKLKKKLMSMESQQKTREAKEKQLDILQEHKKKEKELVKQGKKPFYLKKSEQKQIALVDRFQNMKAKQRDKVIERRRKKMTAKERRNMPAERRTV